MVNGAQAIAAKSGDLAECQNATGFQSTVPLAKLNKGDFVCVFTQEERWSVLKVTATPDSTQIALLVTTYKGATE